MMDRLTRILSRALRHAPDEYGIVLDSHGWADLPALLQALTRVHPDAGVFTEHDVEAATQTGERFEIRRDRIRARYGHSVADIDYGAPQTPPARLFHATSTRAFADIVLKGLLAGGRRYVHMTSSWEYALRVFQQREEETSGAVILVVAAHAAASQTGAPFLRASSSIWLTHYVGRNHLSLALLGPDSSTLIGERPLIEHCPSEVAKTLDKLAKLIPEE